MEPVATKAPVCAAAVDGFTKSPSDGTSKQGRSLRKRLRVRLIGFMHPRILFMGREIETGRSKSRPAPARSCWNFLFRLPAGLTIHYFARSAVAFFDSSA